MEHFDLDDVISVIKGKQNNLSRHIYSLWKHFPEKDLRSADSVQAHIDFQEQVNSDLIKLSPHSKYCLVDFGASFDEKEFNKESGSYITKKYPIQNVKDWEKIDEIDPQTGELGKQLELVKQISKRFQDIPTMMTIFLPTMIARKLVFEDQIINHFDVDKKLVFDRLQVITNVMVEFSKICIELGSKGLFLATQETDLADNWNPELWNAYAYPFDKQVLDKLHTQSEFQVLHLHGDKIFFKEVLKKFKVDAINFHAFSNFPNFFSESPIKNHFSGGLLGGLEQKYFEQATTDSNKAENLFDQFIDTIEPITDRIVLAPNCVLSQSLTSNQLQSIVKKIRT